MAHPNDVNAVTALGWSASLKPNQIPKPNQAPKPALKRPQIFDTSADDDETTNVHQYGSQSNPASKRARTEEPYSPRKTSQEAVDSCSSDQNVAGARTRDIDSSDEDEEDDYLSMEIPDVQASVHETSLQRKERLRRQNEQRANPKSKREIEAESKARREEAMNTAIDSSSKGFKMMAKLGFKAGGTLGRVDGAGRSEPIAVDTKEGRSGIGHDTAQKQSIQARFAAKQQDRQHKDEIDPQAYRDRVAAEREQARQERLVHAAMKVAESLDEDYSERVTSDAGIPTLEYNAPERPLKDINVLWRGLVSERREREAEKRRRLDLDVQEVRLDDYDENDRQGLGIERFEQGSNDGEADDELDEFTSLDAETRLGRILGWMREEKLYCFWCKARYESAERLAEECPGETEGDHE